MNPRKEDHITKKSFDVFLKKVFYVAKPDSVKRNEIQSFLDHEIFQSRERRDSSGELLEIRKQSVVTELIPLDLEKIEAKVETQDKSVEIEKIEEIQVPKRPR